MAVIIVNWNGYQDTLDCLRTLADVDYPDFETIVVDNASQDSSVEAICKNHPWVRLIKNDENLGYVGGNNRGLEAARSLGAEYALLLNNDTEVPPGFLRPLVQAAESDPWVGITGPTIFYYDRPEVIWSAGGAIDWRLGKTIMLGIDGIDSGQFGSEPRRVDFVTGCALLIKMNVVDRIGLLDTRFYAYYEETEWCVRAEQAGYHTLHVPQSEIWHKISPGKRDVSPLVRYYMTRNRLLFLKLSGAGVLSWVYTLVFDFGRTLLSWTLKSWSGRRTAERRAMLRGIVDYSRGRFGRIRLVGEG